MRALSIVLLSITECEQLASPKLFFLKPCAFVLSLSGVCVVRSLHCLPGKQYFLSKDRLTICNIYKNACLLKEHIIYQLNCLFLSSILCSFTIHAVKFTALRHYRSSICFTFECGENYYGSTTKVLLAVKTSSL